MISAMIGEKSFEIDRPYAVLVLLEADRAQKRFVCLTDKGGGVNAAEVDEVERTSSHHEHCLKVTARYGLDMSCDLGEIVKNTALRRQLELTNANKIAVDGRRIGKQIGFEFDIAFLTQSLLLCLGLNGENF